ncbi:MAG: hypothetical protein COA43_04350 [Robiginitomaculum sp.]|nr:MAG: hypothetical protein COA43_04350 [Robiginitomaculum sp.]
MSVALKKIAILASGNMLPGAQDTRVDIFELTEEMGKITPVFKAHGMETVLINWRDAVARAPDFDAMLSLFVWDYFEGNEHDFLTAMAKVEKICPVYNNFDVLKWNANKSYLKELGAQGAATIPTMTVPKVTEREIERALEKFDTDKIVIKPVVGGGAWRQVLYEKGTPYPSKDELPPSDALLQPFLENIKTEGEYSFLYFGGGFSHALIKRAKEGDYRIQSSYGGTEETYIPTKQERAEVRAVLDVLDFTPLYARIDFIRGNNGRLWLIELELIEPYLYLSHAEGEGAENKGAQKLAKALAKKLGM